MVRVVPITILLTIFFLVALPSCKKTTAERPRTAFELWVKEKEKVRILATTSIVKDLVKRVCGDEAAVIALIEGDLDPHSYEMVKGDGEKFAHANLVFANGLGLEHSASLHHQLHRHEETVYLGNILLQQFPQKAIYVDGQIDPHVWMDISLWVGAVDPIVSKLSEKDPVHKAVYEKRGQEVIQQFLAMDAQVRKKILQIPDEKRYLVTSHDAFNYYVRHYFFANESEGTVHWKERIRALQGLAPDDQIGFLQIERVVNYIESHNIKVIFPETNLNKDSLEKVKETCERRGRIVLLAKETLYGDTLGGEDYLKMCWHNASVIENNLYKF